MIRTSCAFAFVVAAALAALPCAAWPQDTARARVAEGLRLFEAKDFEGAERAFAEADVLLPEDRRIAFDRGCSLEAKGDLDKAAELYAAAAMAGDAEIAKSSRYNLGTVAVKKAMASFCEHPEAALPEARQQGLENLQAALRHFQACLEVDPGHADARHNIEALRLWIKHMTALWEEADRQKQRDELDVLRFIEMLQQAQLEIRSGVKGLAPAPDSPQRREAVAVAETGQRKLAEEIPFLKEKIAAAFEPPPQQPGQPLPPQPQQAPPDEAERAKALLAGWADETAAEMGRAADFLEAGSLAAAPEPQWKAFETLDRIYTALAPFQAVLQKSIGVASGQVEALRPFAPPADAAAKEEEPAEPPSPPDWKDLGGFQERVARWASVLPFKADEAAGQAAPAPAAPADPSVLAPDGEGQADPAAAMKQACEKAKELAPAIQAASAEAADLTAAEKPAEAHPKAEEALALLKEIADLLPKNEQDQQQGDGQKQKDGQQEQQEPQPPKKEQQRKDPETRDDLEALLRKAQEKEREHKEKQKEMTEAYGSKGKVEKDW